MAMCLCLFDDDGQTAVVRKKSLSGTFREGELCQFVCAVSPVNLKCEILKIADSADVLNQYELEWQQTPRALEIFKKMSLHVKGGYLKVGNQDSVQKKKPKVVLKRLSAAVKKMYDGKFKRSKRKTQSAAVTSTKKTPARAPPAVKQQKVKRKLPSFPSATSKRPRKVETPTSQIVGTEGRSLNVLFSGGQGGVEVNAEVYPNRSPNFKQHLSDDQQESLISEISFHENGKQCTSVQTEPVVMASTDAELIESLTLIGFVKKYEERLSKIETSISGLQNLLTEGCYILPGSEHLTKFPASPMQPSHHQSLSDSLLPMVKNCPRSLSIPQQSALADTSPSSVDTSNHHQHPILPLQSDLTDNAPPPMVKCYHQPQHMHLQSDLTDSAPTPMVKSYHQPQHMHLQSDLTDSVPTPMVKSYHQPQHLQSDLTDSVPTPMVKSYHQPQHMHLQSDLTDSAPTPMVKSYHQPQHMHLQSDLTDSAPTPMVKSYHQPQHMHLQSDLTDSVPTPMVKSYHQPQHMHLQSDLTDSAPPPMVKSYHQPQPMHFQSDLTDSAPTPIVKNFRQPQSTLQSDLTDSACTPMVNSYRQPQSVHLQSDLTDSALTPMVNSYRQPQSKHLQSDLTDSAQTPMVKNYRQQQSLHLQSNLTDSAPTPMVKNYRQPKSLHLQSDLTDSAQTPMVNSYRQPQSDLTYSTQPSVNYLRQQPPLSMHSDMDDISLNYTCTSPSLPVQTDRVNYYRQLPNLPLQTDLLPRVNKYRQPTTLPVHLDMAGISLPGTSNSHQPPSLPLQADSLPSRIRLSQQSPTHAMHAEIEDQSSALLQSPFDQPPFESADNLQSPPAYPFTASRLPGVKTNLSKNRQPLHPISNRSAVVISSFSDVSKYDSTVDFQLEQRLLNDLLISYGSSVKRFANQLTKVLFSEEDLVKSNFNGVNGYPGFSPRRRNIIVSSIISHFPEPNSLKHSVEAINSSIRGLRKKRRLLF